MCTPMVKHRRYPLHTMYSAEYAHSHTCFNGDVIPLTGVQMRTVVLEGDASYLRVFLLTVRHPAVVLLPATVTTATAVTDISI